MGHHTTWSYGNFCMSVSLSEASTFVYVCVLPPQAIWLYSLLCFALLLKMSCLTLGCPWLEGDRGRQESGTVLASGQVLEATIEQSDLRLRKEIYKADNKERVLKTDRVAWHLWYASALGSVMFCRSILFYTMSYSYKEVHVTTRARHCICSRMFPAQSPRLKIPAS